MPKHNKNIIFILVFFLLIVCLSHASHDQQKKGSNQEKLLSTQIRWCLGIIGGAMVSSIGFIASFIVLALKKMSSTSIFSKLSHFLLSFATASLLTQFAFHLIPQMYPHNLNQHSTTATNEPLLITLTFVGTMLIFIIIEKSENHNVEGSRKMIGYLNLIGSLIHNMIDGMAIGVAFSTGKFYKSMTLLIAIIAHQIPRQMSDVAILLANGFNDKEAIISNGCCLGLMATNIDQEWNSIIMSFISANFLFIASQIWPILFMKKQFIIEEICGIIIGILIIIYGENISDCIMNSFSIDIQF